MKKFISNAMTLTTMTVIALMASSCSLGRLVREETHKEQARIYMNDGTIFSGRAVLPNTRDKYINLSLEQGERKKLAAADISIAEFWDNTHPESHNNFIYSSFTTNNQLRRTKLAAFNYGTSSKKENKQRGPFWMKMAGSGAYLEICLCGAYYSFDAEGNIAVDSSRDDEVYIVAYKHSEGGKCIGYIGSNPEALCNELVKLLADDPGICWKIITGQISTDDFETICNEYSPQAEDKEGVLA